MVEDQREREKTKEVLNVVRANTTRPFVARTSSESEDGGVAPFPHQAPSAPPVPEEGMEETETRQPATQHITIPLPVPSPRVGEEFVWLFEYGIEMDSALLNTAERLEGLALPYGPAQLKDYTLQVGYVELGTGQMTSTLFNVLLSRENAEVWGVLYRIPRRLTEAADNEVSLLNTIHGAAPPMQLYRPVTVEVYDPQRRRTLSCITYVLSSSAQRRWFPLTAQQKAEDSTMHRLFTIARKQRLPEAYLHLLYPALPIMPQAQPILQGEQPQEAAQWEQRQIVRQQERETEPLRAVKELTAHTVCNTPYPQEPYTSPYTARWLIIFACYLIVLLLAALTALVLQSLGMFDVAPSGSSAPLHVPEFVLLYGLIGGCMSNLIALKRLRGVQLPTFVLITWFARPYVGAILAIFAYLILSSGLVALNNNAMQQQAIYLLIGALAGLCERWLFVQR